MKKILLKTFIFLLTLTFLFSSTVGPTLAAMTYLYDANGNMTSDGEKCFHYNESNQMDKVTNCSNGQTIAEYVYDYTGKRIVKREFTNGVLTKTVYSPNDEFEKTIIASNSAVQDTTYYKVNDEVVAKKNPDGSKEYIHNDHLGSTSVVTDQNGVKQEETKYDPWGAIQSGGTESKYQYTGQEHDEETGLDYYEYRYYNSHIRRFAQPDDIIQNWYAPQTLNRYSYVLNNPVKYTDPSGHVTQLAALLAFASPYAMTLATAPDAQMDLMSLSQAITAQQQNNNLENRVNLGIAIALMAAPGASAPKEARQQATKQTIQQFDKLKNSPIVKQATTLVQQKVAATKQVIVNGNNIVRIGSPKPGVPFRIGIGPAPKPHYEKLNTLQKALSPIHIHIEKKKIGIDFNWFKKGFYRKW